MYPLISIGMLSAGIGILAVLYLVLQLEERVRELEKERKT